MGVGFTPPDAMDELWDRGNGSHLFVRGNHDNRSACLTIPNCLCDYGYLKDKGIFYIGGAFSIDRKYRTLGISYWLDEELNQVQGNEMLNMFLDIKPNIVVSHDAPATLYNYILPGNYKQPSYTSKLLEEAFMLHKPKLWVFGHFHTQFRKTFLGCRFVGLDINEAVDININKYKEK